jgi:hypothetical protein
MEGLVILVLMYVAVGAGLFAQPDPGTAVPHDFTPLRQAQIFCATFADVLTWPAVLLRRLAD